MDFTIQRDKTMKSIFAAVALICAPLTAHAIPVVAGNSYGGALELTPGEVVSIEFEITEPTYITPIAISGTGSTAADLLAVTFGVNEFEAKFSSTIFLGNVAAGYAVLEGFLALENFSLLLTDGVISPVQLTYNFVAEVPPPAPVRRGRRLPRGLRARPTRGDMGDQGTARGRTAAVCCGREERRLPP
ncbi:hypothetical protein QCN27_19915 [Cereibacter sp. SYSU M97828]|nr:hypothetical protein [Cereibacter flavus]